jgi:hypothetical protein
VDEVRRAAADVATRAEHVRIDHDRLGPWALDLPLDRVRAPTFDTSYAFRGTEADTAAWVVTFNAVNFGSGWFPHVRKIPGRSGSITMMTRLTERFRRTGPIAAAELATMDAAACAELFGQPMEPPLDELLALFATGLNDLGGLLIDRYGGSIPALIEDADHDAEALALHLQDMPLFRDVHRHGDLDVPLLKRAQITPSELAIALGGTGLGRFEGLDRLTIFADNLVPHVLRLDGVLVFEPELVERIEREELLHPGSAEEVEIRAVAVHAVEQAVAILRAAGHAVTAGGVDHLLWATGQQPRYKAVPRHRARSACY